MQIEGSVFARELSLGKIKFYRPVEFAGQPGTPKDQLASENGPPHRQFCISPSCTTYFQLHSNRNVVLMLKNVNDCLVSLSNALEEQESLLLNAQRDAMRRCEENEPVTFFFFYDTNPTWRPPCDTMSNS